VRRARTRSAGVLSRLRALRSACLPCQLGRVPRLRADHTSAPAQGLRAIFHFSFNLRKAAQPASSLSYVPPRVAQGVLLPSRALRVPRASSCSHDRNATKCERVRALRLPCFPTLSISRRYTIHLSFQPLVCCAALCNREKHHQATCGPPTLEEHRRLAPRQAPTLMMIKTFFLLRRLLPCAPPSLNNPMFFKNIINLMSFSPDVDRLRS
jgi:hypothetical protein